MKVKLVTILLTLAGLLFLVPSVKHLIKGEPLSWSPSLATAIGMFLAAVISLVVNKRKSGGGCGPPSP